MGLEEKFLPNTTQGDKPRNRRQKREASGDIPTWRSSRVSKPTARFGVVDYFKHDIEMPMGKEEQEPM
jgi:hypothetical protein